MFLLWLIRIKKQITYVYDNQQVWTNFHILFTIKFRNELWKKLELKLRSPLKSVAALPHEKRAALQLEICINIRITSVLNYVH